MRASCKLVSQACFYESVSTSISLRSRQVLKSAVNCNIARRPFSITSIQRIEGRNVKRSKEAGATAVAEVDTESHQDKDHELRQRQAQTPWHREGSDIPPVERVRKQGAALKGKLLTTPSRLLKLTLPLTTLDQNSDRSHIEPLALLVHPNQPLSYLERLIQSEIPTIKDKNGNEKIPAVYFRAEDSHQDESESQHDKSESENNEDGLEEFNFDGKVEKTGVIKNQSAQQHQRAIKLRGGPGEGGVESYNSASIQRNDSDKRKFVRWSSSTEVGDFIRDAARGKECAVEIEGSPEIRVGVPSFRDRTHYLRQRLRRISEKMSSMGAIKIECDRGAQRAAQSIAMGGFAGLVSWWGLVYYLTFKTDLGWDVMEPVTYLVGLSGLMGGYLFFLYHNREVSYKSALNMTISARQMKLYKLKGFDLEKWENLVQEGNELRKEIKIIANEYDAEWSEQEDVESKIVMQALREERQKHEKNDKMEDDEDQDQETSNQEKIKNDKS